MPKLWDCYKLRETEGYKKLKSIYIYINEQSDKDKVFCLRANYCKITKTNGLCNKFCCLNLLLILKWHVYIKIVFKELKNQQNEFNKCENFKPKTSYNFIKTTGEHNSFVITYRGPK